MPEKTDEHGEGPPRGPDGRWQAGGPSPNPGGRPGGLGEVRELARAYTREAVETLAELMRHGKGPVRLGAAAELLSRAWGKPAVMVAGDSEGEALRFQLEAGAGGLLDRLRQLAGVAVLEPVPPQDPPALPPRDAQPADKTAGPPPEEGIPGPDSSGGTP